MFCDEVLELVEPIAAGDVAPDARLTEHLRTCPNCTAALESARRIERLLQTRPAVSAPAQFTSRLTTRIRRERWRREQWLDAGFNIAVVAALVLIVAGVWMAMRAAGLTIVGGDTLTVAGEQLTGFGATLTEALPTYGGAAGVIGGALALWWWAERKVSF
jgi:predicted anti-sigma-YlaC factor YlaD